MNPKEIRALIIDSLVEAEKELRRLNRKVSFYRGRFVLLSQLQNRMRDPERTMVCDVIANGSLLPDPQNQRYPAHIICLCGDTSLRSAFEAANREATLQGAIVLAPGVFEPTDNSSLLSGQKEALDALQRWKIDIADLIWVITPTGDISESTRIEIEYARHHGKPVVRWVSTKGDKQNKEIE